MYCYRCIRRPSPMIFTVGFYDPTGKWMPESDHSESDKAAMRVNYLNGGRGLLQSA